ncbi:MAG TPA: nucleoside phosphorylase [Thermotogota bacterium]|nr:nucleoside phosphorylase [Thermotogota bacterium]
MPETVLLPGDPGRIEEIAAFLENVRQVGNHRGYITIVGEYEGIEVAACSSGIGGPSVEIAVVELKRYGVRRIIRIGTSGGVGKDVLPGDLVVLNGCIRYSGAADLFVPVNFPAISDFRTALLLEENAKRTGVPVHFGIGLSLDSFYATKTHLVEEGFPSMIEKDLTLWRNAGALQLDMEAATLFVLSSLLHIRAGAICTVASNLTQNIRPETPPSNEKAIKAACDTVKGLYNMDERGTRQWGSNG